MSGAEMGWDHCMTGGVGSVVWDEGVIEGALRIVVGIGLDVAWVWWDAVWMSGRGVDCPCDWRAEVLLLWVSTWVRYDLGWNLLPTRCYTVDAVLLRLLRNEVLGPAWEGLGVWWCL